MTIQEVIECLRNKHTCYECKCYDELSRNCWDDNIEIAIRSLEKWDEVLKDVQDWQEDFNTHVKLLALTDAEKEATMMYGEDVVNIIGNHMVELEEVEE